MLQRCPGLVSLFLDISTVDDDGGTHQRVLSSADLFVRRIDNNNDLGDEYLPLQEQHQERIVARSVHGLFLSGRWIMDDAFLQEFLLGMLPNLSHLTEIQFVKNSFTAAGLFKVVKESMPAMALLVLREYDPSPEEAASLGLDRVADEDEDGYGRNPDIDYVDGWARVQCRLVDNARDFKLNRSK